MSADATRDNSRCPVSGDGLEMRTSPWLGVVWPGAVTVRSSTRIARGCATAHAHAAAQHRRPRRASSRGQPARGASILPLVPRLPALTVWFRCCVHAAAPEHESRPAARCQPLRSFFQSDQWSDPRPDRSGVRGRGRPRTRRSAQSDAARTPPAATATPRSTRCSDRPACSPCHRTHSGNSAFARPRDTGDMRRMVGLGSVRGVAGRHQRDKAVCPGCPPIC